MEDKTEPSVHQKDNTRDERGRFVPGYTPDTAFEPGQSGNPAGRPKGELSLTASLRAKLAEVPGQDEGVENPRGLTWGELFIERLVKRLIAEGEPKLSQQVLDRMDGKVMDKVHVEAKVYRTIEE